MERLDMAEYAGRLMGMPSDDKPIEVQWAELDQQRAALEAEVKKVKAQLAELEPRVLEHFERNGIQSIKAGGRTVYLERKLWACKAEGVEAPGKDLHDILARAGYPEYASEGVSWQGLSAFFREREKDGEEPVPAELREWFGVSEQFKIRGRKA